MPTSVTIKALKVTVVLPADQVPADSAEWILTVGGGEVPALTLAASINPKSHRKALQTIAALGENAVVLLQGKIAAGDGVLRDAGLTVTERKPKAGEASPRAEEISERGVRGKVKFFSEEKGFGFVVRDDGGGEVFLHQNVVEASGIGPLKKGMAVEADLRPGGKGPLAAVIRLLPEPAGGSVAG